MRYKTIIQQVINDIEMGKLTKGCRMPSLRNMANLCNVSITTVQRAFYQLEEMGWLRAKPQAGFFVTSPLVETQAPELPQFASQAIQVSNTHPPSVPFSNQASGPLGVSQLAPQLVPYDGFRRCINRAILQLSDALHFYPDPSGLAKLRLALSKQFLAYGFPFSAEDLVITNGCIDAIRIGVETTTQAGDAIAISSPCFNGIIDLLSSLNRKVVEIPCLSDGIDLDQFECHLKAKTVQAGVFSTSHMNPQGTSLSPQQKQRLAQLANEYRIPVIEDDIYIETAYAKTTPFPTKYWDTQGYVLWCGSVSKTLSAGLRIGWCLPGQFKEAYQTRLNKAQLGIGVPMQAALAEFIASGQYHKHIQTMRLVIRQQVLEYKQFIAECFPDTTRISSPEGGFVLWLQLPDICPQIFATKIQQSNIDIRLGENFSSLPLYKDCIRINCGWPLDETVKGILMTLAQLVNASKPQITSLESEKS
jgi:DNA-binding transcriptional MocR family regulator